MIGRSRLCLLALAGCLGTSVGCGSADVPAPTPTAGLEGPSGVRGSVILGSTCPVEELEPEPCLTPYAATLVITSGAEGTVVARVSSGVDGRFEVEVPPGDYVIVPEPGDPFPQAQPIDLTVVPGVFEEVQINYDTGIR